MSRSRIGWGRMALGAALIASFLGRGQLATAQEGEPVYVGAYICSSCHDTEYQQWMGHGHAWMQVRTAGQTPPDDLFAPLGLPLPPLRGGLTWDKVQAIVGHFKDGNGGLLASDGKLYRAGATPGTDSIMVMPGRCNKCHNTAGTADGTMYGTPIQGTWKLDGIQCEHCHGPGPMMELPSPQICRDCHSSGDSKFRIPFDPAEEMFVNHHPEGDEYRRSPHKNLGCTACHDPHKSVWKDEGGVKFADPPTEENIGTMCAHCHDKIRIRGSMGEIGLTCLDCHMPEASDDGERHTHLFRINTAPLAAANNWKTEKNDSNRDTKYWMNFDGTTGEGDSFLTIDMVCAKCHSNMSLDQMARAGKYIHRQPGLVDLTVNGGDMLQTVSKTKALSVAFSLYPEVEGKLGARADIWVLCQGPRGWTSWDGKSWKSGMKAWQKNTALANMTKSVLNGKLSAGSYTYWVQVFGKDGNQYMDSVPVYVTNK